MSTVLDETRYVATQWSNANLILGYGGDARYCAGCNGSFLLVFTDATVADSNGVYGVGFDIESAGPTDRFPESAYAFVTFGDGTVATAPLDFGFWGITANQRIQSVHVGRENGDKTGAIYIEIDNLTIGSTAVIGVTIDIKPGSFPNSINLGARGKVPVAILSTSTFDAADVDPGTVTLAGAAAKARKNETVMASLEDVNGDGRADLVVHVQTDRLMLDEKSTEAVLEGATWDGRRVRGVDSVRIVR